MKSPLAPRLLETFDSSPAQLTTFVLELWGMLAGVVGAISLLDGPAAGQASEFTLVSALYVPNGVATRQEPSDAFAPEEWNTAYLETIGCLENLPAWEKAPGGDEIRRFAVADRFDKPACHRSRERN
jgi:hypothetical protein